MNKMFLGVAFICFLLCGFPSVAQQVAKKPNNSPRFLNKNYTYGPVGSLPIGFRGVDYLGLITSFKRPPVKGEYESSAAYAEKIAAWADKAQIGEVLISAPIAVELPQLPGGSITSKYDADENKLTYRIDTHDVWGDGSVVRRINYFVNAKNLGKRKAVTRMGVPFMVSGFDVSTVGVFLNKKIGDFSLEVDAKPEEAKRLRKDGVMFVIGRVVAPYIYSYKSNNTASLDSPVETREHEFGLVFEASEIVFVDGASGKVVVRRDSLPDCTYSVCDD